MRAIVGWGPDAGRRLLMLQISSLLPLFPLFLLTAVITHLVMSFGQTLMHYKLGHHRMGGRFFHNHINFHHAYYSKDHLVSRTYLGDEGNNTPFFFIPVFLAARSRGKSRGSSHLSRKSISRLSQMASIVTKHDIRTSNAISALITHNFNRAAADIGSISRRSFRQMRRSSGI
jgi:hypothetical protein